MNKKKVVNKIEIEIKRQNFHHHHDDDHEMIWFRQQKK